MLYSSAIVSQLTLCELLLVDITQSDSLGSKREPPLIILFPFSVDLVMLFDEFCLEIQCHVLFMHIVEYP